MVLAEIIGAINERCPDAGVEEQKGSIVIKREALLEVAAILKDSILSFENLHCVTAVDWKDKIEMVYIFYSFKNKCMMTLKTFLPDADLTIETLCGFWKSANWLEREVFDLYGVKFLNHPDMRRILNPDEWTDYPLRKNFDRPDFIRLPQSDGLKAGG